MASIVLRVGLKPCITQPVALLRSSAARTLAISKRRATHIAALQHTQRGLPLLVLATSVAGIALGISSVTTPCMLHCDAEASTTESLLPILKLSASVEELMFGICGSAAGFVVRKFVAHLFAYFLCGPFIILECLETARLVKVDWPQMGPLYATDMFGRRKAPTAESICKWIADSLTTGSSFVVTFKAALVHKS